MNPHRLLIFADQFTDDDLRDIPHEGLEVVCVTDGTREQLLRLIPDFDAYMCTL